MKKIIVNTIKLIKKGEFSWIPSSLAFYLLLSIVPLLLSIIIIVMNYFSIQIDEMLELIKDYQIYDILHDYFTSSSTLFSNIPLVTALVILVYTLFLSSRGLYGLSNAVEKIYNFKKMNIIYKRIYAYITTVIIVIAILGMILFAGVLPFLFSLLNIKVTFIYTYIITFIILYFVIHLIYLLVTQFRLNNKEVFLGALFSTITIYLLLVFSNLFFYKANFNVLFGSFAIILLITQFFFYVSFCLYIGILINKVVIDIKKESSLST